MTPPKLPLVGGPDGVALPVVVVAGTSRTEIVGPHGDALRVRVAAAPQKGRANREVGKLLEEFFGVPARLINGATSRRKRFLLQGANAVTVLRQIQEEWPHPSRRTDLAEG